jgi:putative DNA methylase
MGFAMLAAVGDSKRGRVYLPADADQIKAAQSANPSGYPETDLPDEALGFRVQNYGIKTHAQMFTKRQLATLVAMSDSVRVVRGEILKDSLAAGLSRAESEAYSHLIAVFLAMAIDRCADFNNSFCGWSASNQKVMHLFGRQIIPMVWDFAEANMLGATVGSWLTCSAYVADCIETLTVGSESGGVATLRDAATQIDEASGLLVSTDPPYYNNIGYAALSDFFYIWLRRTIGDQYPDLFSTVLVPKLPELVASPELFNGDSRKAKEHFESGFRKAFVALRGKVDCRFPLTVYYAFRQDDEDDASAGAGEVPDEAGATIDLTTGWETLLEALLSSGFQITATWPIRASQAWRMRAMGSNALASYIVLACRVRPEEAPKATSVEFRNLLRKTLPQALLHLQQGNIVPVDFAQAALGPGMAIYSEFAKIVEPDGKAMGVRSALALINRILDEVLAEQDSDFDANSRWAVAWFEQYGFSEGEYGVAETLTKAKNTSINGLVNAGIVLSKGGKVRLLGPNELMLGSGADGQVPCTWQIVNRLVGSLNSSGEKGAAQLLVGLGATADTARELAYRLYSISERKKRPSEALAYNSLVQSWPEIARLSRDAGVSAPAQTNFFGES